MILVTGPESSGTSLVTRIVRTAGGDVAHRSATFPDDWENLGQLADDCEAVVVVFRDPFCTMGSQINEGLSSEQALNKLRDGYQELGRMMFSTSTPLYCLTYEQLILDPESIRPLLIALGLNCECLIEAVTNENAKYTRVCGS